MGHNCRVCGVILNDDNWYPSYQKSGNYICNECHKERSYSWAKNNPKKTKIIWTRNHRKNGHLPFYDNKECPQYLGIHIAERMLRHLFNDVEVMPYGNKGYDIICNKGKRIDSKCSCVNDGRNRWTFNINHNIIADYFICLVFDNREYFNPLHIWLIPGYVLNHLSTASISQSTIHKWDEYELPIDEVSICCDTIRGK